MRVYECPNCQGPIHPLVEASRPSPGGRLDAKIGDRDDAIDRLTDEIERLHVEKDEAQRQEHMAKAAERDAYERGLADSRANTREILAEHSSPELREAAEIAVACWEPSDGDENFVEAGVRLYGAMRQLKRAVEAEALAAPSSGEEREDEWTLGRDGVPSSGVTPERIEAGVAAIRDLQARGRMPSSFKPTEMMCRTLVRAVLGGPEGDSG